ncbi:MAG: polysaccharide deacetylase family protein, partial [Acutalibacteraceae bacterium]|nr:polysaccharide deacetylase family protein [Acutalibacteraceae bacterium]
MDEIDETKNLPLNGGFAGGSGTATDPYLIENATQLRLCVGIFGDNKYFKFTNDIYLNDITKINWSTGAVSAGYEPAVWFGSKVSDNGRSYTGFGDIESTFNGHIDGDGYALYGIYYRPYANYDVAKYGKFTTCAGLIPSFNTGSVSNLTIKNSYLASGRFAGVITADSNAQVLVTNVAADETVTITGNNAGVLNSYGKNYESSALGGMIGYIRNTVNTTHKNCSYAGKINAVSGIGSYWGLVGTHWNSKFTVIDSFSVGIAPVASIQGGIHGTTRNITVSNVYSTVTPSWFVGGGTVNGTITVVPSVTGENALSAENMANRDKTVWYAVKDSAKAPMLRIYGTNIGDVNENAKGAERDDEHALRATLIGAENYMNTDYNRDNESNVLDLVALHNDCSTKDDDWRSHPEDYKLLAFTFDDGPDDYSPSVTQKVADTFAANNGSATFFFIGNSFNTDTDPDVAKYVLTKGSEIANHSYNHKNAATMDAMSEADFNKEFEGANALIKEKTGVTPKYWRGGGFAYSERIYEKLEELGMPAIGCN